jgi:hypothetical protein
MSAGGQQPYPGGLHASLTEFADALQRSYRNTEALSNCHQVFQELSSKEAAEQSAHKMSIGHASEYGTDDGQSYQDDNRSNGSQQPEKKMRRGVSYSTRWVIPNVANISIARGSAGTMS